MPVRRRQSKSTEQDLPAADPAASGRDARDRALPMPPHLWSPNGCSVFVVEANPSYQEAMVETLAVAANAASAERLLSNIEMTQAAQVRLWSRQLALDAHLLTTIASSQCVTAVDDQTAAEEEPFEAMADAPAAAAAGAYQRDPIAEAAQRAKEQFWGLLDRR